MFVSQEFPIAQVATLYDVPENTLDSFGQPSQTPILLVSNLEILVRPLRGAEILNVRQQWPTASHYVEMDWLGNAIPTSADNPGDGSVGYVLPQMKLILQKSGQVLNILQALNVNEMDQSWKIVAEEKIGATS